MNPIRKEENKSTGSTRQRLDAPIPFRITPQSRCLCKSIHVEHLRAGRIQDGGQPDRLQFLHLKGKKESQPIVIPHGSHKTCPDKDIRNVQGETEPPLTSTTRSHSRLGSITRRVRRSGLRSITGMGVGSICSC